MLPRTAVLFSVPCAATLGHGPSQARGKFLLSLQRVSKNTALTQSGTLSNDIEAGEEAGAAGIALMAATQKEMFDSWINLLSGYVSICHHFKQKRKCFATPRMRLVVFA